MRKIFQSEPTDGGGPFRQHGEADCPDGHPVPFHWWQDLRFGQTAIAPTRTVKKVEAHGTHTMATRCEVCGKDAVATMHMGRQPPADGV